MNNEVEYQKGAVSRVYELLELDGNFDLMLRTYIVGGGCSGFEYAHSFEKEIKEGDLVLHKYFNPKTQEVFAENPSGDNSDVKKLTFVIDPISINYLIGAKIDYVDDLTGSRFVISNPNASSTCSCGSSFAV